MNLCISLTHVGLIHSHIAAVLIGSTLIPSLPMMNPRYSVSVVWNSHFPGLIFISDFSIAFRISRTSLMWSIFVFQYTRTSSKYTMQHMSTNWCSVRLIHCWNAAGALHNPKGMTWYLYVPNLVVKVVFHSSPSLIHILWYASLMSSFVKNVAPWSRPRASPINGKGYRSFLVMSLSSR